MCASFRSGPHTLTFTGPCRASLGDQVSAYGQACRTLWKPRPKVGVKETCLSHILLLKVFLGEWEEAWMRYVTQHWAEQHASGYVLIPFPEGWRTARLESGAKGRDIERDRMRKDLCGQEIEIVWYCLDMMPDSEQRWNMGPDRVHSTQRVWGRNAEKVMPKPRRNGIVGEILSRGRIILGFRF